MTAVLAAALVALACSSMRSGTPILPVSEYEKLLIGRLDANYIGMENCLMGCHDLLQRDLAGSTMGAQLRPDTGVPLVDCESCHGPGSLAVAALTPERIRAREDAGEKVACDHDTLIQIDELPAPAKSLLCLKCHTNDSTFSIHDWNGGAHTIADVSCIDCHDIHEGPDLIVRRADIADHCGACHLDKFAASALPSRHPIRNTKVVCTDCHNPHSTPYDSMLVHPTVEQTCGQCHGEKQGPFAFGHGGLTESCTSCHLPHGSVNDKLLVASEPFLCLQCHTGHWLDFGDGSSALGVQGAYYSRCSDCHASVHGSDVPSAVGGGALIR